MDCKTSKEVPILFITTFGGFDIKLEENSLLNKLNKSYKILELLKYFITFNGKKLLPEAITDNIWPESDFQDPKNVLRTQIFRLRQLFEAMYPKEMSDKYLNLLFVGGYYMLSLGEGICFDVALFEKYVKEAAHIKLTDTERAAKLYKKAIELYKGDYLGEDSYSEWVVPMRNHFRRLYMQSVFDFIEILKDIGKHTEIIEVCEEVIRIEPTEESIHIYLMESMLKLGQARHAMSHYEYASIYLARELGVKPSQAMKSLFKKIQSYNDEKGETDIRNIDSKLEEEIERGPLFVDLDYFKFLYNLSKRRSLRQEATDYIGLVTLSSKEEINISEEQRNEALKSLKEAVYESLRKGDIFSIWNERQIVVILADVKEDSLNNIGKRISSKFSGKSKKRDFELIIKFQAISSADRLIM